MTPASHSFLYIKQKTLKPLLFVAVFLFLAAGNFVFAPKAGAIFGDPGQANITADNLKAGASSAYNVFFNEEANPNPISQITITFPAGYAIANGSYVVADAICDDYSTGNLTCSEGGDGHLNHLGVTRAVDSVVGDSSARTITITLHDSIIVIEDYSGFMFKLKQGIINPIAPGLTGTFSFTTDRVGEIPADNVAGVTITAVFAGGTGIQTDPYQIETCGQLESVDMDTEHLGAYYVLNSDLDCTSVGNDAMIGSNGNAFIGTFDGGGHKIKVDIESENQHIGLFAQTTNATISNLWVSGTVQGGIATGGLIGYAVSSTVSKILSSVDVTSASYDVGGIIGFQQSGTTTDSYFTGKVVARGIGEQVGGIVGMLWNGLIQNTYSSGVIDDNKDSYGGIAGAVYAIGGNAVAENSFNVGYVNPSGFNRGGVVGYNYQGTSNHIYYDPQLSGAGDCVGQNYNGSNDCTAINTTNSGGENYQPNYFKNNFTNGPFDQWSFVDEENPDGIWHKSAGNYPTLFDFPAPPIITGISPVSGTTAGGDTVVISGSGFDVQSVSFDGVTSTIEGTPGGSEIDVVTPVHSAGAVNVVVANFDGQKSAISFTYNSPPSNNATLTTNSTIKGVAISILGTPQTTPADVVAGAVTLTSTQASDTSIDGDYITAFFATDEGATISKVVKYASGATPDFDNDTAYNGTDAINDQDFFIVKVTAADSSVLYYKIVVTVDASITYTLAYSAGTGGTISGTSPQTINEGSDGEAVTAIPNEGYHFVNWSDDSTDNPRTDTDVTEDISVIANFAEDQSQNEPINVGPTADKFQQDITSGFITATGDNPTATDKITFTTDYTIINGDAKVVLPAGTEMTKTGGGTMDLIALNLEDITQALKNISTNTIAGAVSIGIPGLNLSFSKDITVTIPVDSSYNGQTLNVYFQSAGQTDWTSGLSCEVADGLCVFQTDHATKYSAGDEPTGTVVDAVVYQKAKIDSWDATLITDQSSCSQKMQLTVKGHHFAKNAVVKIGDQEASSVKKKSSRKIVAKFCLAKLTSKYLPGTDKIISVKNPHTSAAKAKKKIDIYIT